MAALSYVLFIAVRALTKELARRDEPAVVQASDRAFAIVAPGKNPEAGRIVGTAIDLHWARSFAAARSGRVAEVLADAQQLLSERSDDDAPFLGDAAHDLGKVALLLSLGAGRTAAR